MFRIICLVAVLASPCFSQVTAGLNAAGDAFEIFGTTGNDSIVIHRKDEGVDLIINGSYYYFSVPHHGPSNNIPTPINAYMGDGNDSVYLVLPQPESGTPTSLHDLNVYLDGGDDYFTTDSYTGKPPGQFYVVGGPGDDTFDLYGSTVTRSHCGGGNGSDNFYYRLPNMPITFSGGWNNYTDTVFKYTPNTNYVLSDIEDIYNMY